MKLFASFAITFLLSLSISQSASALSFSSELKPQVLNPDILKKELFVKRECASNTSFITAPCPTIPGYPNSGGVWTVAMSTTTTCVDNGQVVGVVTITSYLPHDSNPCQVP
jgi:hypothetical protein